MLRIRNLLPAALLAAGLLVPASAADETLQLARALPARTPVVLHVRSVPELLANWEHTPFAHTWNEPDVQRFFAPLRESFDEGMNKEFGGFEANTGLTPRQALDLFTGEAVVALLQVPDENSETGAEPMVALGARIGDNRAKIEEIFTASAAKAAPGKTTVDEEFQGETLHVVVEQDAESGERREAMAWAIVDDVFWTGEPKSVLQEVIANWKRGGAAESLATAPGFSALYRDNPQAHVAFHLNLEPIVQLALAGIAAQEAAAAESGEPAQRLFGLSTQDIMRALGFDSLRSIYAAAAFERDATVGTGGVTWSAQRGILGLLAYGDPPAPQPGFVSDTWQSVNAARFSFQQLYLSLKDIAREANPMLEAMLQQQIAGINQALGIDLERDFFGSLGDEVIEANGDPLPAEASPGGVAATQQLYAVSLANADAFRRSVEALMALVPPQAAAMIVPREYLGETIRTFATPAPAAADGAPAAAGMSISYAITQSHLFLGVGSAAMIETAIQALQGTGKPLWTKPEVAAAIGELPPGGSSVTFSDMRKVVTTAMGALASAARMAEQRQATGEEGEGEEDGSPLTEFCDPDVVPSAEVVEKHWSTAAGSVYRRDDGLHMLVRIKHVD